MNTDEHSGVSQGSSDTLERRNCDCQSLREKIELALLVRLECMGTEAENRGFLDGIRFAIGYLKGGKI